MYSYIVVDDEVLIRKGLIGKIESIVPQRLRCVGEASNGKQGLELIRERHPDIVITDMKMNQMSGVEFLEILGEQYPEMPVIVISGYKDFNYVKKAIENRVVGYVLKPFSVEEIEKQLNDAIRRIRQKKNIEELREKVDSFEQKKSQETLRPAVLEPWSRVLEDDLREKGYDPDELFHMAVCCSEDTRFVTEAEKICGNVLRGAPFSILENPVFKNQYFVMIPSEKRQREKYAVLTGRMVRALESGIKDTKLYICYTETAQRLSELHKVYQTGEQYMRRVRLGTEKAVWKIRDRRFEKERIYSEEQIQKVFREIKYHKDDTKRIMEEFFDELSKHTNTLQVIGVECERLLRRVDEYAIQEEVDTDDIMRVFYHRYLFCDDTEKMRSEISGYVTLIINSIMLKKNTETDLLERIEEYIRENYHKKLTLTQISDQFCMTPASCSNLLRQRLGKSFNEYVSEIRINKAKELLRNTDLSIDNISEEIGYANPKYFFRIFKKNVMCTPIEYRNQNTRR